MRKILLVGGDSFSDQHCYSYNGTDVVTWPILLAEKLDMDLVCLAQSGAGNEQIYSSIQDYICDNNSKNIGMVIAAWSKAERMDYELEQKHTRRTWFNTRESPKGGLYYFIRKSIRNFYNLQMLCENHNIPYKQFQMISLFKDYIFENYKQTYNTTRFECINYITDSPQFFYINQDNFIGWPIYDEGEGFVVGDLTVHKQWRDKHKQFKDVLHDYVIGPNDGHPNKIGHRLIMEFIHENL